LNPKGTRRNTLVFIEALLFSVHFFACPNALAFSEATKKNKQYGAKETNQRKGTNKTNRVLLFVT
jgi:hypothetical protein